MSNMKIQGVAALSQGVSREGPELRTYNTYLKLQSRLNEIDVEKVKNRSPYLVGRKLVLPADPRLGCLPPNARLLPVKMPAFKNIVTDFIQNCPEAAEKEMVFLTGAMNPSGYVSVGARGTALSIPYHKETGIQPK